MEAEIDGGGARKAGRDKCMERLESNTQNCGLEAVENGKHCRLGGDVGGGEPGDSVLQRLCRW